MTLRLSLRRPRQPYANAYVAGVALGLVLLAAFAITGRGLGASGAFAITAAGAVHATAPAHAEASPYFSRYVDDSGARPWRDWIVIEIAGVFVGGLISAWLAGRWRIALDRPARVASRTRLLAAAGGGCAMGIGAVLARGCTSGQALTGGAMLSVGSWLFIAAAFGAAFAVAPVVRGLWR